MQDNDQRPTIKDVIIIILGVALMVCFLITVKSEGRYYDCGMAEWHPDIPNKVKEECRRLHYEEWKRQQEESKKSISV